MKRVLALILTSVVFGGGCNWLFDYYTDANGQMWNRLYWKANLVPFGKCHQRPSGGWYYCLARPSQMVMMNGRMCMPTDPIKWCEGDPPPIAGLDAIYIAEF